MSWNRKYHLFLFFGDTTGDEAPWSTRIWKENILPKLDILLRNSTYYKNTGIGTIQYIPKPNSEYYERLKLGKLGWNESSHDKWTLTTATITRRFHHVDIWTPSRGTCEKMGFSPDIYFCLSNERATYNLTNTEFEWFSVLAVAIDIQCDIMTYVVDLSKALSAKKTVYKERGWQQKLEDTHWNFVNSIQDTFSFDIYKGTNNRLHTIPFQDIQFGPFWETIFES